MAKVITIEALRALQADYIAKVASWEAAGTPFEGATVDEMSKAEECFIKARTASLAGVLMKLEHVAETDNMIAALVRNPKLTTNRLVLGLIRDIRLELSRV